MEWKFNGSQPVYQQIMAHIRDAVLSGEYPPGSRIPSVRELAAQARVNPNTMQRALVELEREELLVSGGTMGRHVTDDRGVLDRLQRQAVEQAAQACIQRFQALGLTVEQAAAVLLEMREKKEEA